MALTLRGDGTGTAYLVNSSWWNDYYQLLTGGMTDQPVTIANKLTVKSANASFAWGGTLAGANKVALEVLPTDTGSKDYQLKYLTNNHLQWFNATDNKVLIDLNPTGKVDFPQGLTSFGIGVPAVSNKWGANSWTVSDVQPGSAVKGDVWVKTSFA